MIILYLLLFIIAIKAFYDRKYSNFLLLYLGMMTSFFMLDKTGTTIGQDLCLAINILISTKALSNKREAYDDPYSKWCKVACIFFIVVFLFTIITGQEEIGYAVKVIRIPLFIYGFWGFRTIPLSSYELFLKKAFVLTIIQGILYYLQFVGIHILAGYNAELFSRTGYYSALNIPVLTYFYIFYVLNDKKMRPSVKYCLLVFFIGMVLMRYVRVTIFALLLAMVYYLWLNKKGKQTIIIGLLLCLFFPFASSIFEQKDKSASNSTLSDIQNIVGGIDNIRQSDISSGTFSFRLAMLVERWDYLVDNPQYLVTGIGAVHEDSPNCYRNLSFSIGTFNPEKNNERCQIESGDITWVPILLRYGILGVILYISILVLLLKYTSRSKGSFVILGPAVLIMTLNSLDGALFEKINSQLIFFLYLVFAYASYKEIKFNEQSNSENF